MPSPIQFDWSEDDFMVYFVLHQRGASSKTVNIELCDVFVRVNCHPALFEVDLRHEIDVDDPKTRCRVGSGKVMLNLKKLVPGLWKEFRASGSKDELKQRRRSALAASAARDAERNLKRSEWKEEMLKAGETMQWSLDQRNREQIESWEQEEKKKWEDAVFGQGALIAPGPAADIGKESDLDDTEEVLKAGETMQWSSDQRNCEQIESGEHEEKHKLEDEVFARRPLIAPGPSADIWKEPDLDDTEEYVPEVRENPGKVGVRFSERPRPGVPVRDRGQYRQPPLPKGTVKSDLPPMLLGDEHQDEQDPVWMKDKADNLMVSGDYLGAMHAYTSALKLGTNARAFANRAVAHLYLGNLESCIEDCGHTIRILDLKYKVPAGHMANLADPQDQLLRSCAEVRMGTAYLWLGAFGKSEEHFTKALEAEDSLDSETRKEVKEDLARIQAARRALVLKEKADAGVRRATGGGDSEHNALTAALGLYDDAASAAEEASAGVLANRCFARLRSGLLDECRVDGDAAIASLKLWPVATRPPSAPLRPARLDPPYLDDPTFKHPDEQKQGEVDWLMKHGGGTKEDLPSLPEEYEWVRDAAERGDNCWIAVKKKMTKMLVDTIKRNTVQLQDVVYTRNAKLIRMQLPISTETNKVGEGPSNKALRQAEEYAAKLEAHDEAKELERAEVAEQRMREKENCDLEQLLSPSRSGAAVIGFGRAHPVEKTRRRLFVKTLLRQARADELLGDGDAGVEKLNSVLRVDPENPEAKQRLSILLDPPSLLTADVASEPSPTPAVSSTSRAKGGTSSIDARQVLQGAKSTIHTAHIKQILQDDVCVADDDDKRSVDHASTNALLNSAAEYMKKNDYTSALQVYNYSRRVAKGSWETPLVELKVLSNTCLCLQRIRGRLPELVEACDEVMDRIHTLRAGNAGSVPEETLLHMESACLARRGSALAQLKRIEESARDAARVREIMAGLPANPEPTSLV